ncbi:uncharacterized protein LOC111615711 [Centruroides sculpturatus]|uniref:uncharacterized protein LOC111615711 n=1 Tax=Centruroides sculpturatus TaxID=218467 RepID=UPI000C6D7097|nr:uncharacterized protein LOC111615711 [Centruroides sculpturatus]
MQRSKLIPDELGLCINKFNYDVLIVQEPYAYKNRMRGFGAKIKVVQCLDQTPWAALIVCQERWSVMQLSQFTSGTCAAAQFAREGLAIYVASFYFPPNDDIRVSILEMERVLQALQDQLVIVGVDSNAKNPIWGSDRIDDRGELLLGLFSQWGYTVLNRQSEIPTFRSTRGSSFVDVAAYSAGLCNYMRDCVVTHDFTSSDHALINYEVQFGHVMQIGDDGGYSGVIVDWRRFIGIIRSHLQVNKVPLVESILMLLNYVI